jgi:hypothetical protein
LKHDRTAWGQFKWVRRKDDYSHGFSCQNLPMLLFVGEQARHKSCVDQAHIQVLPQNSLAYSTRGTAPARCLRQHSVVLQWWYWKLSSRFRLCRLWRYDLRLTISPSHHLTGRIFTENPSEQVTRFRYCFLRFPWSIHQLIFVTGTDVLREVWTELVYII